MFFYKEETSRELSPQVEAARAELINIVNNFFFDKLMAILAIKGYIGDISSTP